MNKNPTIIKYPEILEDLMPLIVKRALSYIENNKLPGAHYFYISFSTAHPNVEISSALVEKYPKEMTIVLQYQFEDLIVDNTEFSITLLFNGVKERLKIPYSALTGFIDPYAKFGVQLNRSKLQKQGQNVVEMKSRNRIQNPNKRERKVMAKDLKVESSNNVVSLESFKKKTKED